MAEIRWSPEAFERVKSIKEFIERDSPSAAHEFVKGILKRVENLARFPQMGRRAFSGTYPNLRFVVWKRYKIYYEFNKDRNVVEVWGVWDSRSMMPIRKK